MYLECGDFLILILIENKNKSACVPMAMAKDRGDGVAYLVGKRGVRGYVDDGVVDRYETVFYVMEWNGMVL